MKAEDFGKMIKKFFRSLRKNFYRYKVFEYFYIGSSFCEFACI